MMRTAIGLSLLVALAIGGIGGCSGDKKDEATGSSGSGGNGNAGGNGNGGSSSGATSQAGNTNTSGSNAGSCAGKVNMCLDAQTVQGCDPETGEDFTVDCSMPPAGITSMGCDTTEDGTDACIIDFEDPECLDGATVLAVCLDGGEEGLFNAYLNCFADNMGAHAIVTCLAPYLDIAAQEVDCSGLDVCEMQLGGGGAPSDGGAGPGPDPMGGAGGAE